MGKRRVCAFNSSADILQLVSQLLDVAGEFDLHFIHLVSEQTDFKL